MKHERAAVMALTFCIGFTTALIAYGIPTQDAPIAYVPTKQRAVVHDAVSEQPTTNSNNAAAMARSELELTDQGLYLLQDGERTLLSVSTAAAPDIAEAHTAVHAPLVSPDGSFVFFCVETATSAGACAPRVFDVENYELRAVQTGGGPVTLAPPADLSVSWSAAGNLTINNKTAANANSPWLLE